MPDPEFRLAPGTNNLDARFRLGRTHRRVMVTPPPRLLGDQDCSLGSSVLPPMVRVTVRCSVSSCAASQQPRASTGGSIRGEGEASAIRWWCLPAPLGKRDYVTSLRHRLVVAYMRVSRRKRAMMTTESLRDSAGEAAEILRREAAEYADVQRPHASALHFGHFVPSALAPGNPQTVPSAAGAKRRWLTQRLAAMVLPDALTIPARALTSATSTVENKRYDSTAAAAADTGIRPATPQRMRHAPRRPAGTRHHHCDCDLPRRIRPAGLDFQLTMAARTRRLIVLCYGGGLA
jgi:hypothetical protein